MIKKLGIPILALAALLCFGAPRKAEAAVRFGIGVGVAPAYPYYSPYYAAPVPYSPYVDPYDYAYPGYVAPYAAAPYGYGYGFGLGWRGGYGRGWAEATVAGGAVITVGSSMVVDSHTAEVLEATLGAVIVDA